MAHPEGRIKAIAVPDPPASTGVQVLEKGPKVCHFVPFFGTPGAPPWRRASRRKRICKMNLGHEMWVPGRREGGVA
jgi:hypothetical protein